MKKIIFLLAACLFSILAFTDTVIDASIKGSSLKPFWRKGSKPTIYPTWYENKGPVTHEVFYDNAKSATQNGAILEAILENLTLGDHVKIHSGTYSISNLFQIKAVGSSAKPIFITAASNETVVITRPNANQNCINIDDTSYLVIDGIQITNGDTGVKIYDADHLMIVNCKIFQTAGAGITANAGNTSYLYLIDNEVTQLMGTAEGYYIGANSGTKVCHHSYFCGNYIYDLTGSNVEQGDGIEIKDGSYANTIKYNYITNTKYPCITIYGTQKGANDRNVIEDNVLVNSQNYVFQFSGEAIVRNNVMINNNYRTVYSTPIQNATPGYIDFHNNTILSSERALNVNSWTGKPDIKVSNNFFYSSTSDYIGGSTGSATIQNNIQSNELTHFVSLSANGSSLDARPHPQNGSSLINIASSTFLPNADIMGYPRDYTNDVGAQNSWIPILWSESSLSINENSMGSRDIKLAFKPIGTVKVAVSRKSGDSDLSLISGDPQLVTFSTSNWNSTQSISFQAAADADATNGSAIFEATKHSGNDILVTSNLTVNEVDGGVSGYTITATTGANGTISPKGSVSVSAGANKQFIFIPNNHYQIEDVKIDNVSKGALNSYQFTNISSNHAISVSFIIKKYQITASAGSNGSISPNGNSEVNSGSSKAYTIQPDANFSIKDVLIDGVSVGAVSSYTFSNVTSNHTIEATFVSSAVSYQISASAASNGIISPSGQVSVAEGGSKTFSFTPQTGFQVKKVLVDGIAVTVSDSYAFTNVSGNHSISVEFEKKKYSVSSSVVGLGTITPNGNFSYYHGNNETFLVTPDSSYTIQDVTLNGISQGAVSTLTLTNITSNQTIVAKFKIKTYTIIASAGSGGTLSPIGNIIKDAGTSQTFQVLPQSGFEILDVKVNGISKGKISSFVFNNLASDQSIYATFNKLAVTHTINASAQNNGDIVPAGNVFVGNGKNINFSIIPKNGYEVDYLLVDGNKVNAASSYEFKNVSENHSLVAYFKFSQSNYTITASSKTSNGKIVPDGNVVVAKGASQKFTIEADAGYQVSDVLVNGVSKGSLNTYEFLNVTQDHTIEVSYSSIDETFFVDTSVSGDGSIEPSGKIAVSKGASKTFTISPSTGKRLDSLLVDGQPIPVQLSYTFNQVEGHHSLKAVFVDISQSFLVNVNQNSGGKVFPSNQIEMAKGEDLTLYFQADSGYYVKNVMVNNISVGPLRTYTIHDVDKNIDVDVEFMAAAQVFQISSQSSAGGSISLEGVSSVASGDSLTYEFKAEKDFVIDEVFVDGKSVGALSSYTFYNVSSNHTISVNYIPLGESFYIDVLSGDNGNITPSTSTLVGKGNSQIFTMVPDKGYQVSDVIVDQVSIGPVLSYSFTNVVSEHSIQVVFSPKKLSSSKSINEFKIFVGELVYMGELSGQNINVNIPSTADVRSLVAQFSFEGNLVEVEGASQISGVSLNDFSSSVNYKVIAEDGSSITYQVVVSPSIATNHQVDADPSNTSNIFSGGQAGSSGGGGCQYSASQQCSLDVFSAFGIYCFLLIVSFYRRRINKTHY